MNAEAVCYERGPFHPEDILASRMVADPFHLLDCSVTSEGGIAMIITALGRARDLPYHPVFVLGGGLDQVGPSHQHPASTAAPGFDSDDVPLGYMGRRAARTAFRTAGLSPCEVDVCEFYDAFSFEVIRQLEAFGFCDDGEGGPFVECGNIALDGNLPINTDGSLMAYSQSGTAQSLQRVERATHQLQGRCATGQVERAEVALASTSGAGVLFTDVILLGSHRP